MPPAAPKNLPTDVLRTFVAIVECGGFTRAGERLGRSQAAVSLQIKKLESLVGQPLFERTGARRRLTATGESLLNRARQILALNDRALREIGEHSVAGRVRLGIPSEFATALLPRIVGRFASENPHVTLEANCDLSKNLLADLERGRYDLVLGLHPTPAEAGKNRLGSDRLLWVAGRDFPARAAWQGGRSIPLICAPDGCIYRSAAVGKLAELGRSGRVVYTIQDLSGICSAIDEGLGITVLAASTVPRTLRIIGQREGFPPLGKIGISLLAAARKPDRACLALRAHIEAALSERVAIDRL